MKQMLMFILAAVCLMGCTSAPNTNLGSFSDAIGKDWKLSEVQIDSIPFQRIVLYDRNELRRERIENIYTINFGTNDMVSGVGAPNRYSGPYKQGEEQSIEIGLLRSTLMASIVQPEKLQENVYYGYLHKAYKWEFKAGAFILHCKNEANQEVRLIFIQ